VAFEDDKLSESVSGGLFHGSGQRNGHNRCAVTGKTNWSKVQ